ncbi:hypothetical protein OESDEN_21639 [Oesophagostomum dentatum]|uniref:Carboxylesterase type B domain-containing protein n=1 Tax=Oesophagostomum dentatum TaxID=61180 RepID=A0A0B1S084_OESDE|nr:hypothetical protein OESDEN_21639 [Oesophagostomum dentatum]
MIRLIVEFCFCKVRTRYGIVEGFRLDIGAGKEVDLFLGIPFAAPPVGELRFQKPQPPGHWDGVRRCVAFGPRAPQADFFWERITLGRKSEDCLYLNVFSPTWKSDEDEVLKSFLYSTINFHYSLDSIGTIDEHVPVTEYIIPNIEFR